MKFLPDLETVKKIAETKKYHILPVSCEILSDICTPIEAMRKNISMKATFSRLCFPIV